MFENIVDYEERVHSEDTEQVSEKENVDKGENPTKVLVETFANEDLIEDQLQTNRNEQIPFAGKYTPTEISKLKENVSNLERAVSYAKSDVSHWKRCFALSKSEGDASNLKRAEDKLRDLEYKLKDARTKLSYAT